MMKKVRVLICLAAVCCLAFGSAFAAGGHAYETEVPPDLQTPVPTEVPTAEPTATPTAPPTEAPTEAWTEESTEVPTTAPDEEPEKVPYKVTSEPNTGMLPQEMAVIEDPEPTESPAAPSETTADTSGQESRSGDSEEVPDLPAEAWMIDPGRYIYGLHTRSEAYHPASVLISGILMIPEDREILSATVAVEGGGSHEIPGTDILRMPIDNEPSSAQQLTFEPDRERAGFAFLVDLSGEDPAEGTRDVTVTITTDVTLSLETKVQLNPGLGQYYHAIMAIHGRCLELTNQGEHVNRFQERLAELGYLRANEISGIIDDKTMAAAKDLLSRYEKDAGNSYLNAEEVGFILSDQPEPKPEGEDGLIARALAFFKGTVHLFDRDIPIWMLTAAGAALLLILLIVILVIAGKRKKAKRRAKEASAMNELSRRSAFITGQEEAEQTATILSIGDEPTMDLSAEEAGGGLVFTGDEPTTDMNTPLYEIKLRLIYSDQYMDTTVRLQEGGQAVIGRGDGAQIQANPSDTSVSHQHGFFTARGGTVMYTDNSRNGTTVNGQRRLQKGESMNLPLNTRMQIEVGNHKVLVLVGRTNG